MEPPAVQFLHTPDGVSLAYAVSGAGAPLLMLPFPFNHLRNMWGASRNRNLFEAVAARFRLVQYDSRGHGMSQRGLSEGFELMDFETDLLAVLDHLKLERVPLLAFPLFCQAALRFAREHPERVEAVLLHNPSLEPWGLPLEELAAKSWPLFLEMMASTFGLDERPKAREYYSESVSQRDFLTIVRAGKRWVLTEADLSHVHVPVLVMTSGGGWEEPARSVAAALPDSRLVIFPAYGPDLYGGGDGAPPQVVTAIEEFLGELAGERAAATADARPASKVSRLSPRELQVLSLIAEGKSNREIATELVISERTVINHVRHIFEKTGSENRAGATAHALRNGLV